MQKQFNTTQYKAIKTATPVKMLGKCYGKYWKNTRFAVDIAPKQNLSRIKQMCSISCMEVYAPTTEMNNLHISVISYKHSLLRFKQAYNLKSIRHSNNTGYCYSYQLSK